MMQRHFVEFFSPGTFVAGGKVETLEEVKARARAADSTLILNMEGNGYDRVVTNTNSWTWTQPFKEGDVLLDFVPPSRHPTPDTPQKEVRA